MVMDNSQSSDCFPDSADNMSRSLVPMDTLTYETLLASTKQALDIAGFGKDIQKDTFCTYFTTLLEDCSTCINQSLDLIAGLMSETDAVCISKLTDYLDDAVCLLQMLSDFIKTLIESVSMSCCSMKTFPQTVGQIIFTVFTHCKYSESLYGNNLGSVEKQLKDLFRNCYDLQLTYLMILEKHFIFDLTEDEEKEILNEALHINLKIGEIVQSLDVKTMAEQWKAYTMICEKYSAVLSDSNIFQDCTQILCKLIMNDIKTAFEINQEEKVVTRSLKVASFTIKILLKTCHIFKNSVRKDYTKVLDLLFYIHTACFSHLGPADNRFPKLAIANLAIPSECLLKELLSDDMFSNSLFNHQVDKNEDTKLGLVLTITTVMRYVIQGNTYKCITKIKLINCVYEILPYCHVWFTLDHLLIRSDLKTLGLFEHLLCHTSALAFTLNNEEFSFLERKMIEAILDTECCGALFSANLWLLMARHFSSQLLFNQLIWLCTIFKKLENHKMFYRSPQKVHISYTITGLFELMENDDKMKICKQYRIHDDDNVNIWTALGVNRLPEEVQLAAEEVVAEKLKTQFQCFSSSKNPDAIMKLIQVMNLASKCSFSNVRGIEEVVLKAWSKTCPNSHSVQQHLDSSTVWFYDYLQALVSLTDSIWHRICEATAYLIKMLHLICSLIQQCGTEIKLLLMNTLCKLAASDINENKLTETNFSDTFKCLFKDSEGIVRNQLLVTLRKYRHDNNLDTVLSNIEYGSLQECWCQIKDGKIIESKVESLKASDFKYKHKCFENKDNIKSSSSSVSELHKASSSNFDFADIDHIFENNSDSEQPVCKRVKLNSNEAEVILKRLETDVSLLRKVKENVFTADYRSRIQNIRDKLGNIIN